VPEVRQRGNARLSGFCPGRRQQQKVRSLVLAADLAAVGAKLVDEPRVEGFDRSYVGHLFGHA
jgi:hypothetical protein